MSGAACPRALIVLLLWVAGGCSDHKYDVGDFLQSHTYAASGSDFKVMPGDVVSFSSPHVLEIDGISQQVDIDGAIDLDLIDRVHVAGLTPRQIKYKVESQLVPFYKDPSLRVRVVTQNSKKIYVFGQVGRPGSYPFTGRDTVFDVLMAANPTFIAWKSEIKLIRSSPNPDERREMKVDFDKMATNGDMRMNMLMQEGDILYVPPTPLGWLGLRLRELLFPITPALEAYEMPARFLDAQDDYDEHFNGDDDGDTNVNLIRPGRLLR
ncbi:MAG: polysaccharide export protein [Phycisphaerales bacterium]|nr:MAG: polysaccharide export protein [Phycisphaerales bacterium]